MGGAILAVAMSSMSWPAACGEVLGFTASVILFAVIDVAVGLSFIAYHLALALLQQQLCPSLRLYCVCAMASPLLVLVPLALGLGLCGYRSGPGSRHSIAGGVRLWPCSACHWPICRCTWLYLAYS